MAVRELIDIGARAELRPDALAEIAKSPVPVLLPRMQDLAQRSTIMAGPHWFAASLSDGNRSIAINATRASYETEPSIKPDLKPNSSARGIPAWLSRSEGIWSIAGRSSAFRTSFGLAVKKRLWAVPMTPMSWKSRTLWYS